METIANVEPVLAPIINWPGSENVKNILFLTAVVFSARISTSVILYAGKAFLFSWQFTA